MSAPLRALALRGRPQRYPKSRVLIQEGEHGDTLFIIVAGRVRAYSTDERDREVSYGEHGVGALFGEMSLDGGPRSASVVTLEPTTCIVVTRQTLREHIAANPEFAFELLARVIQRARLATLSVRNMALLDVYGRVIRLLDELAVAQDDGARAIPQRPTHAEIASRVGCSREMVSKLLKDLERGGFIETHGATLRLKRGLPAHW